MTLYNKEFEELGILEQDRIKRRMSDLIFYLDCYELEDSIQCRFLDFVKNIYWVGNKGHFNMSFDELIKQLNYRTCNSIKLTEETPLKDVLEEINYIESLGDE